jgi:hypothetical protein
MILKSVKSYFAIHEVVVLTGFSKYMLDYLRREEIFAPSGKVEGRRGLRRCYAYEDVVLLRALSTICAGKGKIRHLKDALVEFRKEFGCLEPGQRLNKCLFVQGNELCVYTKAEGGRQLRSGQMTLSFVVDMAVVSQEIANCIVVDPSSREFALTRPIARKAEKERQRIWAPVRARREAEM